MNKEFKVNSIGHWQGLEQILDDSKEVLQSEFDDTQKNQIDILSKLSEVYTGLLENNEKLDSILDALNTNGQQIVSAINEVKTTIENNKV